VALHWLLIIGCGWAPGAAAPAGCPADMARIAGADGPFCIHRHELRVEGSLGPKDHGARWPDSEVPVPRLVSAPGQTPSRGVSWYQAEAACRSAGMALCTSAQWEDACDGQPGPGGRAHPVAAGARGSAACNIRRLGTKDPSPTGSFPECVTPEGVFDLEGNVWEWTDPRRTDATGRPLIDKRGGAHDTGEEAPCAKAAVGTHDPAFAGSIGFRCCRPLAP